MTLIRPAVLTERTTVLATLGDAFAEDPVHRWIFEDPAVLAAELTTWFGHLVDMVPPGGLVEVVDDGSSAAIWHAPADPPAGADDEVSDEMPPIATHLIDVLGADAGLEKLTKLSVMVEGHPPEPHWYLAVLGSAAVKQGSGQGSALLEHRLAECDATGTLAYLESSNPRNVPFYARHGFEVTETIRLDGDGPEVAFMLRQPR